MPNLSKESWRTHALRLLIFSPYYLLLGAWVLARGAWRLPSRVRSQRSVAAEEIRCPHGHLNATTGRWKCSSCGGVYLGWVGRCDLCGAPAGTLECSTCRVTVRLPWERRW